MCGDLSRSSCCEERLYKPSSCVFISPADANTPTDEFGLEPPENRRDGTGSHFYKQTALIKGIAAWLGFTPPITPNASLLCSGMFCQTWRPSPRADDILIQIFFRPSKRLMVTFAGVRLLFHQSAAIKVARCASPGVCHLRITGYKVSGFLFFSGMLAGSGS